MKQRRWDLVHKFEDDHRRRYLKNLTQEEGFMIMANLYKFGLMGDKNINRNNGTKERMISLIKERKRFKKIAI